MALTNGAAAAGDQSSTAIHRSTSDPNDWIIFKHVDSKLVEQIKLFFVFGEKGAHALFITNDDNVYGVGFSESVCLGISDGFVALQPKVVPELCQQRVTKFAHGYSPHMLALSGSGRVFAWGSNNRGQLGLGSGIRNKPQQVDDLASEVVVDIACGLAHSAALTQTGALYSWGCDAEDQVGTFRASSSQSCSVPQLVITHGVVSMTCGMKSTHVVMSNGVVTSWGSNEFGNLGRGCEITYNTMRKCHRTNVRTNLPNEMKAVRIVSGSSHCLVLTDKGHVYGWGNNEQGQLACSNSSIKTSSNPIMVAQCIGKVTNIAAVHYKDISIAKTFDGCVYVWGMGISSPTLTPLKSIQEVFTRYAQPSITYQTTYAKFKAKPAHTLLKSIKKSFNDNATSDLNFEIEGKQLAVHRAILIIRCEYFRNMLQHKWRESDQEVIEIKDYSFNVYSVFLKYLYTDAVDDTLSLEELIQLYNLAKCYCESALKCECESLVREKITVANAVVVYEEAVKIQSVTLQELALNYSAKNLPEVMKSPAFSDLTDNNILRAFTIEAVCRMSTL